MTVDVALNVNGMYRIPIGHLEVDGNIPEITRIYVRGEAQGEQAEIIADALASVLRDRGVSFITAEITVNNAEKPA